VRKAKLEKRSGVHRFSGSDPSDITIRLKNLIDQGHIRGFRAILNPQKLGLDRIAFVEVRLSDTREKALAAFNAAVMKLNEVEECHMIAGSYDYLLKVGTSDIKSYRMVLGEKIRSLTNVASTYTFAMGNTAVFENNIKRPRSDRRALTNASQSTCNPQFNRIRCCGHASRRLAISAGDPGRRAFLPVRSFRHFEVSDFARQATIFLRLLALAVPPPFREVTIWPEISPARG
jgi:Lrp/AsnC family leucine-responsive transcriptional regulator